MVKYYIARSKDPKLANLGILKKTSDGYFLLYKKNNHNSELYPLLERDQVPFKSRRKMNWHTHRFKKVTLEEVNKVIFLENL